MADRREPAADMSPSVLAAEFDARLRALPVQNTPSTRAVRREYSRMLRNADPGLILDVARELYTRYDQQGMARELILYHRKAFCSLGEAEIEEFGRGINSWWSVDGFARDLAGRAWREGQVSDALIHRWAHSPDRWWRRAALVSTVPLNVKAEGGTGDVLRTLEICQMLAADHDDMVAKALSWALRELVRHDAGAVQAFLTEHEHVLAARVKREVTNKLTTGLKNPRKKEASRA
jgi:3-methyladenine DNA glycosylase AlkD